MSKREGPKARHEPSPDSCLNPWKVPTPEWESHRAFVWSRRWIMPGAPLEMIEAPRIVEAASRYLHTPLTKRCLLDGLPAVSAWGPGPDGWVT